MDFAKDEEYVRTVLASNGEENEDTPAYNVFNTKVKRSLQHSEALFWRVWDSMKEVEIRTPSGIYVGRRPAFKLDTPRFDRVMKKIGRGLHFHETGLSLPDDVQFGMAFNPDPMHFNPAILEALQQAEIKGSAPEVFRYRYVVPPDISRGSVWAFQFYLQATFLVFLLKQPETNCES